MSRSRLVPSLLVLALAGAATALSGCSDSGGQCTVPDGVEPDWTRKLACPHDYTLLESESDDAVFAHTSTINWLIDREDGDRVYFINSRKFDLHFFFASAYLNQPDLTPVGDLAAFNLLNYGRPNRRFVLGKLVQYRDQGLLTLEFSAGDSADAAMIVDAFKRVASSIYNGSELRYRPVSARHENMLPDIAPRIPVVRTEEVFSGQVYQPLEQGTGYGTLRFRRVAELAGQALLPTDLAVLDRVPNDISMVSGIITDEFQTPLSHINILSKNRGTPNMALRGAFDDPALRALEGQLVRLDVGPQEFTIAPASAAEAQAYFDSLRPDHPLVPDFDVSVTGLVDLATVGADDADIVGAKAANLAELAHVTTLAGKPIALPEAPMAIPFARYQAHLLSSGVQPLIDALLADVAAGTVEPAALERRLFAIRWQLFTAPLDAGLASELAAAITARYGAATRLRFRSSTNVEDLAEFSGAGLYTSAAASLGEGPDAVARAVKVVWASAWNPQAFVEREFYRVEHARVRMGVLVHPAFDEEANGVAVTINEFAALRPAYYINSQIGEVSVTNPTGLAVPEQILYYTWYDEPEYEVITRSSLVAEVPGWPAGLAVLSDAELAELASYLEAIHRHFSARQTGGTQGFAMDVEFKLAPGRRIIIKQARPLGRRNG